jgi:hypothetical protein
MVLNKYMASYHIDLMAYEIKTIKNIIKNGIISDNCKDITTYSEIAACAFDFLLLAADQHDRYRLRAWSRAEVC